MCESSLSNFFVFFICFFNYFSRKFVPFRLALNTVQILVIFKLKAALVEQTNILKHLLQPKLGLSDELVGSICSIKQLIEVLTELFHSLLILLTSVPTTYKFVSFLFGVLLKGLTLVFFDN